MAFQISSKSTRQSRAFVFTLAIVAALSASLTILAIGTAADAYGLWYEETDGGISSQWQQVDAGGQLFLATYPEHLRLGRLIFAIAGVAFGLPASVITALLLHSGATSRGTSLQVRVLSARILVWTRRAVFYNVSVLTLTWAGTQASTPKRHTIYFLSIANVLISLAAALVLLASFYASARFDPNYRSPRTSYTEYGPGLKYDDGTFDLGAWSCQLHAFAPFSENNTPLRQCRDLAVARWCSLVLVFTSIAMGTLVLIDRRAQKSSGRGDEFEIR